MTIDIGGKTDHNLFGIRDARELFHSYIIKGSYFLGVNRILTV